MALVTTALSSALESQWLPGDDGPWADSASDSADKFAGAVANWFASATAGAFPCSTAAARRGQLKAAATGALEAGQVATAASQLALALMGYMAGQSFGAGVASAPTAVAAAQSAFAGAFSDLQAPRSARASQIAGGVHTMALSTIVVFPPPISPPTPVS